MCQLAAKSKLYNPGTNMNANCLVSVCCVSSRGRILVPLASVPLLTTVLGVSLSGPSSARRTQVDKVAAGPRSQEGLARSPVPAVVERGGCELSSQVSDEGRKMKYRAALSVIGRCQGI